MLKPSFALLLIIIPTAVWGQGVPLKTNISPEDYNNHRQNWAVVQADDGKIYLGNSAGILMYDGAEWDLKHVGGGNVVWSLLNASDSRIYYGGQNDFGYISNDSLYRPSPVSLSSEFVPDSIEFGNIQKITEYREYVYFQSPEYIFKYSGNGVTVIEAETAFSSLLVLDGKLYSRLEGVGLVDLTDPGLTTMEDSRLFSDKYIYGQLTFNEKEYLFSRPGGITIYNDGEFTSAESDWMDELIDARLYRVTKIDDSGFAVATLNNGVYIIDDKLNLIDIINEEKGLPTNAAYNVYTDSEKNIWVALDNGISIIHSGQPLYRWNETNRLSGAVTRIEKTGITLYAGTTEGLFRSEHKNHHIFQRINGISRVVDMVKTRDHLLISDINSLISVYGDDAAPVVGGLFNTISVDAENNNLYVTRGSEVFITDQIISREPEKLLDAGVRIRQIYPHNGLLWVLTFTDVMKYSYDGRLLNRYSLEHEDGNTQFINAIHDELVVGTNWGMFLYDSEHDRFQRPKNPVAERFNQVSIMQQCGENDFWIRADRKIIRGKITHSDWEFFESPYQLIAGDANEAIYSILCDGNSTWFGGTSGIYELPQPHWEFESEFNTNITRLYADRDSLIYGGFNIPQDPIVLPFNDNSLRFTFAAASYIKPSASEYQVKLEGFDKNWSTWTNETFKDYTNIREGSYTFRVRSKNVFDVVGTEAAFSFSILPPWYRTIWAYLLYAGLIGGLLFTAHNVRIRQILKIQNIRNRIAGDLHDEVSATLSSISYFAQAVKKGAGGDPERFVSLISESADDAKEKITDIIWAVNPEHDDWELLVAKCQRFASDLLESSDIRHHIEVEGQMKGRPDIEVRQHFWLIFKEMVTNAVRHSGATQVNITLKKKGSELILVVQDNGNGFDHETVEKGNGLNSIRKRAEQINAKTELKTEPGFGTRWKLSLFI